MGSVILRVQKRLVGTTSTASVRIATPFYMMLQLTSKIRQVDGRSKNYDLQHSAIAHSLPQALFAWALLLLVMQAFLVPFADLPLPLSLAIFLLVAAVLVIAQKVVYPTSLQGSSTTNIYSSLISPAHLQLRLELSIDAIAQEGMATFPGKIIGTKLPNDLL